MSKPLALPENQARALIRAAKKEGARVEVLIGGTVVRLVPEDGKVDSAMTEAALSPLERWKAARNAGKAYRGA